MIHITAAFFALREKMSLEYAMLTTLFVVLLFAVVYWFTLRRWFGRWGTTHNELTRLMSGDAIIAHPTHSATQALTVDAPPGASGLGLSRWAISAAASTATTGSIGSFGFLHRWSANRILPEFQHLDVGDNFLLGPEELTVAALEPFRSLVLSYKGRGMEWVWQFGLYPLDNNRTRLVTRGTERTPQNAGYWLFMRVMEPAAFIMTRRMLLGLKQRAETLKVQKGTTPRMAVARP